MDVFAAYYAVNLEVGSLQKITTYSSMFSSLLNIGLNFLLIPRFHIFGAAASTFISFASNYLILRYYGNTVIKLKLDVVFICKCLVSAALISQVARIYLNGPGNILDLLGYGMLSFLGYAFISVCMRAFSWQEVVAVRKMIKI